MIRRPTFFILLLVCWMPAPWLHVGIETYHKTPDGWLQKLLITWFHGVTALKVTQIDTSSLVSVGHKLGYGSNAKSLNPRTKLEKIVKGFTRICPTATSFLHQYYGKPLGTRSSEKKKKKREIRQNGITCIVVLD